MGDRTITDGGASGTRATSRPRSRRSRYPVDHKGDAGRRRLVRELISALMCRECAVFTISFLISLVLAFR